MLPFEVGTEGEIGGDGCVQRIERGHARLGLTLRPERHEPEGAGWHNGGTQHEGLG